MTTSRRARRSREYWLEHARAADQSEQSVNAYALAHGISVRELYRWRGRLRREGALAPRGSSEKRRSDFVRVEMPTARSATLRIGLPNGCTVSLDGAVDARALEVVLRAAAAL